VWDAATGKALLTLTGHPNQVNTVAFSPDGKRIVSAGRGRELLGPGEVKVWDAGTGQDLFTLRGHKSWVGGVAFSPDGKRIVSASGDRTVKVWDAGTLQFLCFCKGHTNEVTSVAFSSDGERVFGRDGLGKVLAWDAATGCLLPDAPATLPDGRRVASRDNRRASAEGPLVRVERILTPDEQRRLHQEQDRVQRIVRARASSSPTPNPGQ
jgi:WD40 repeat protein